MTWDAYADGWDDDEAVQAYSRAAFDSLRRICTTRGIRLDGARVCDFGCGTGLMTEKLAPICSEVVAVDTSVQMIARLQEKIARLGLPNVRVTTEGIEQWRRSEGSLSGSAFDLVVCSSVCAFVDDYPATVAALVDTLAPGGMFIQWDWELDPSEEEPYGLTREGIAAALQAAGLEAIEVETAFEVPMGEMVMRPLVGIGVVSLAGHAEREGPLHYGRHATPKNG